MKDYIIVQARITNLSYIENLIDDVNDKIKEGYLPIGGITSEPYLCQVMIKKELYQLNVKNTEANENE